MLLQLLSLLAIFLPLAPVHASIATSIDACSIDNVKSTKALKGTVYKINEKSASLSASEQYYKSGYTTEDIVTTFTQSSNIAFQIPGGEANFYGAHFDTSHFVLQESGYFKAPSTGLYKFDLSDVDDGALVSLGGAAYDCCTGELTDSDVESFLFAYKLPNDDSNPTYTSYVYLEEGLLYPFKLVYFNAISAGSITLNVTPPNEKSAQDAANFIYQISSFPKQACKPKTVSTVFSTSTSWVYVSTATYVTQTSSLVTLSSKTYIEQKVTYGVVHQHVTSYSHWTGTTTSYTTKTTLVTDGYVMVREEVDIYRPPYSSSTVYDQVDTTKTITNDKGNVIVVHYPISTTVMIGKKPETKTTYITKGGATKVVEIYVTNIPTTTIYPDRYTTDVVTSYINKTWYQVVYENVPTVTTTVGVRQGRTYPVTTTIYVKGRPVTSTYVVQEVIPPRSTGYTTGTGKRSEKQDFIATSTGTNGKEFGYWTVIVYLPPLATSVISGDVELTTTITSGRKTYVQVVTNVPTVVTYWNNPTARTAKIVTTVSGTSTGWVQEEIYPSPQLTAIEYSGSTTITSTQWITNNRVQTVGYNLVYYVPSYSISYSFYEGTKFETFYTTSSFSYGPDFYGLTTVRVIVRPPMETHTEYWTGSNSTTSYLPTTYPGNGGIPVTNTFALVLNPEPTVVFQDCSSSKTTITCTGKSSVFTLGSDPVTITSTECNMPTNLTGSFLPKITSSTYSDSKTTKVFTYTNIIEPTITCPITTSVTNCQGTLVSAICTIGTTVVLENFTATTTSCALPENLTGTYQGIESVTTIGDQVVTVTNNIKPSISCAPSTVTSSITNCDGTTVDVTCLAQTTAVTFQQTTALFTTTSCAFPETLTGSFATTLSTATVVDGDSTTHVTLTNTNSPVVLCPVTTSLTNCQGKTIPAVCQIGTTAIDKVIATTTSCAMPKDISGTFQDAVTTTVIGEKEYFLTNVVIPDLTCAPSTVSFTFSGCNESSINAQCVLSTTRVTLVTSTATLTETSCDMPETITGSFATSSLITTLSFKNESSIITLTNVVKPQIACSPLTSELTIKDCRGSSHVVKCLQSVFYVQENPLTATSCVLPSAVTGSFPPLLTTTSVLVQTANRYSSYILTNYNSYSVECPSSKHSSSSIISSVSSIEPSFISTQIPSASSVVVSSRTSSVVSSSVSVSTGRSSVVSNNYSSSVSSTLPSTITITTENSECDISTTTITGSVVSVIVVTPPPSCFISTITTTLENSVCLTATSTITQDNIVSLVVATPPASCFVTTVTTTLENSVCSFATSTETSIEDSITLVDVIVATPPPKCNLYYTEEPALDCTQTTFTSFIGTINEFGKYVNATLVIVETPAPSCSSLSSMDVPVGPIKTSSIPTDITTTSSTFINHHSTVTKTTVFVQTITSCSDNKCHITEIPATSETITENESTTESVQTAHDDTTVSETSHGATTKNLPPHEEHTNSPVESITTAQTETTRIDTPENDVTPTAEKPNGNNPASETNTNIANPTTKPTSLPTTASASTSTTVTPEGGFSTLYDGTGNMNSVNYLITLVAGFAAALVI
ncbi:hypothetical protein CANINC_002883 [Pichia inconspicua]|uniref:PA14 domain-containing protein n=1 Tax=Pichia inconspicua TaxID=52247 RepID=A0A4T0X0F2_9ASCO|nr:hypothetical protein CANINC_002883 [[Candida] inconspicua]